jgi:hypothetical protein
VQGETIYAGRTNVITLTHGLLLIVLQAFGTGSSPVARWVSVLIGVTGIILSAAWLAFEQRNQIYFNARGAFLAKAEEEVLKAAGELRIPIHGMWTTVPPWVKANAKWYQRYSAPKIQRGLVPILFICLWSVATAFHVISLATDRPETPAKITCGRESGAISCEIPPELFDD